VSGCEKCGGTGWYTPPNQRGTVHGYVCDACCKHDKGRWQLTEDYGDAGKWCCKAGCGKIWDAAEDGNAQ
jgi:hypothetical protein